MAIIRQQIPMTKHETLPKGKGLQNLTSSKHSELIGTQWNFEIIIIGPVYFSFKGCGFVCFTFIQTLIEQTLSKIQYSRFIYLVNKGHQPKIHHIVFQQKYK